jgi:multicomponent K+:H+ antiporter subunit A
MLSLESFTRLARRAHVDDPDYPMDIDPSREVDELKAAHLEVGPQ